MTSANAAARKILIAGSETGAAHLAACLDDPKYAVCAVVGSGREAITAAEELQPDLALIDLELHGAVSGVDAGAHLRNTCGFPVIYVADDPPESLLQAARETEPAGYLFKPFAGRQLLMNVDAALQAHRRETGYRDRVALLQCTLDLAADGVVAVDRDREYLFVSSRAEEILGTLVNETDPRKWHETFGIYRIDGTTPFPIDELPIMRALAGESVDDMEMLIRNPSRPEGVYISVSARPLCGQDGADGGALAAFHDVTRRKRVEAELRTALDDLRRQMSLTDTVLKSISDGLIVTDGEGDIITWNDASERILGKAPTEMGLGKRSEVYGLYYPDRVTMIPPEELPTGRAIRGSRTESFQEFVRNEAVPDGVFVSVSGSPMYGQSGDLMGSVIVIRDVTRFREAEAKLRETTAALQAQNDTMEIIFNSISDGVVVADEQGNFVMFNPSATRIVGIGATDAPPEDWSDTYGIFFPDKVTPVPTDELPLVRAIRGESIEQQDLFIRNAQMPEGAYISVSGRPMRDEHGNLRGGVAVFRDVTRQIEADQALTEAFAQGRLEVVDTILHNIGNAINSVSIGIGTISDELARNEVLHRFRALAAAVEAHRDDWLTYLADDPQGRQVLPFILSLAADFQDNNQRLTKTAERMKSRVAHIVDIIRTQKSFSDGAMVRKVVNVRNAVVESIKVLAESTAARGIEIEVDSEDPSEEIWIQESRLHQMLVNLVKNAVEAIDEKTAANGYAAGEKRVIRIGCYRKDHFTVIDVVDNGIGIDDVSNQRIFSAGYTTKTSGSGLGLHSTANFVIGSGGRISALSDGAGKGATLRVMLRHSRPGDGRA